MFHNPVILVSSPLSPLETTQRHLAVCAVFCTDYVNVTDIENTQ